MVYLNRRRKKLLKVIPIIPSWTWLHDSKTTWQWNNITIYRYIILTILQQYNAVLLWYTVNEERFPGLNFCGFHLTKFLKFSQWLMFKTLKQCHHTKFDQYSHKNFSGTLEKCESLAQWIFPCLQYCNVCCLNNYTAKVTAPLVTWIINSSFLMLQYGNTV